MAVTHEIQTEIGRVTTIYDFGAQTGKHVFGKTANGMRVYLEIKELPFDLASLVQTNAGSYDAQHRNIRIYAITAEQRQAMLTTLAAKVAAREGMSRTAPAALVAR